MLEQGNQCDHGMSYEERPADGRTAIKRIFGATDSRRTLSLKSVEIFSKSIKFLSRMYPISYKHANACYKIHIGTTVTAFWVVHMQQGNYLDVVSEVSS